MCCNKSRLRVHLNFCAQLRMGRPVCMLESLRRCSECSLFVCPPEARRQSLFVWEGSSVRQSLFVCVAALGKSRLFSARPSVLRVGQVCASVYNVRGPVYTVCGFQFQDWPLLKRASHDCLSPSA